MTISVEDKLLSDLGVLVSTCRGDDETGNQEVTQDPDLLRALLKIAARCQSAWDALVTARSAYDADQTENKVAALTAAQAFARSLEEHRWLQDALSARLLKGRTGAALSESERVLRAGWMRAAFPHTHNALAKIGVKDALNALAQTSARVSAEGSLATTDERAAFEEAVSQAQQAHEALTRERLDDKPLSDTLRSAFVGATSQRVGARAILQGILGSEGSVLDLDDLLTRRSKRAPAATQASQSLTPLPPAP